jgi:hypothetical protein
MVFKIAIHTYARRKIRELGGSFLVSFSFLLLAIIPLAVKFSAHSSAEATGTALNQSVDETLTEISLNAGLVQMSVAEIGNCKSTREQNCIDRIKVQRDALVQSVDRLGSLRFADPIARDSLLNCATLMVKATDKFISSIEWRDDDVVVLQSIVAMNTDIDLFIKTKDKWRIKR